MKPTLDDIAEVERMLSLWGHLLDDREWDRLGECLSPDARYDGSVFGFEPLVGLTAIREGLSGAGHALAHHATNVLVLPGPAADLDVRSKGLGVLPGGIVSSVTYVDRVRRTDAGWRIADRVLVAMEEPDAEPATERNKRLVREYMDMLMTDHEPARAVAEYLGEPYIQHNPNAPDGAEGVLAWVGPLAAANPELSYEIKRMSAEDDLVWVHGVMRTSSADRGLASMEIFRVRDAKLVEHWDVTTPVPETSANDNTMF